MIRILAFFRSALPLLVVSTCSNAHVKWFVEFDVTEAPRQIDQVLNPMFWGLLMLASATLLILYSLDVMWTRSGTFDFIERRFNWNPDIATHLMRIGVGVFFIVLWLMGDVILTPDLVTDAVFVGYIQFFTAFFTLFSPTLVLTSLGILSLYVYGTMEYGLYHMLDYATFLGVAAFFAITESGNKKLMRYRLSILVGFMLFSFLWSAIEKFGYPQWFDPFLDENEFLTMGLPRDFFLMAAAFVEFTLVYVLLTGRNVVVLGAIALNALIVAGALYFGKVDALGHFLVITILLILTIKATETVQMIPYTQGRSALAQGGYLVLGYWVSLALFFGLYYGLHAALY